MSNNESVKLSLVNDIITMSPYYDDGVDLYLCLYKNNDTIREERYDITLIHWEIQELISNLEKPNRQEITLVYNGSKIITAHNNVDNTMYIYIDENWDERKGATLLTQEETQKLIEALEDIVSLDIDDF